MTFSSFDEFFRRATGALPFPYQSRFAEADDLPELVHAPTGAGKTATAILGWIWRYFHANKPTPRRLAYCLPMRVLVEQTRDEAEKWRKALELTSQVKVHVLMGGEEAEEWDLNPEEPAILIGTQDMLLSRALNRGYGMGRFRWPMHFGLLNNDCLWVLDEIQLMGTGLATSTQLQAFRKSLGVFGTVKTVWMSATLRPEWLASVDFRERVPDLKTLCLDPQADHQASGLRERWEAKKPIENSGMAANDKTQSIAEFVRANHKEGSLTLVIVNTVDRSRDLFKALRDLYLPKTKGRGRKVAPEQASLMPDLKLIHARFRPKEREDWRNWLTQNEADLRQAHPLGRIVISTQVVEAGVDLSARTLITELAPWPSLVQRFGRCNRRGEFQAANPARVFWLDVPATKTAPYSRDELDEARTRLQSITDVGLKSLTEFFERLNESERQRLFPFDPPHVIRRKDFIDLFDTTPDLAGNDIDVSRFIRDGDELDVQVFWRPNAPDNNQPKTEMRRQMPQQQELCTVSFTRFRDDFLREDKTAYRWDALDGKWERVRKADADTVYPGQVYWVEADQGGYDAELGWDPDSTVVNALLLPLPSAEKVPKPDAAYDDDDQSRCEYGWQTIGEHTDEVVGMLDAIVKKLALPTSITKAVEVAVRWHDWGKAHVVFQSGIKDNLLDKLVRPSKWAGQRDIAKAPDAFWGRYKRKLENREITMPHFRHELASALGVLVLLKSGQGSKAWHDLDPHMQNLALYLIAAHHGKVRLSIRSLPDEISPARAETLFARGIWQGDQLPGVDLGGGEIAPATQLDLSPMLLGQTDGRPSWAERMLRLRDDKEKPDDEQPRFGPLKLAYLEALVRAADIRASKAADAKAKGGKT